MSLDDKKHSYLQKAAGGIILFAVLGACVLCGAAWYLTSVFQNMLPK